MCSSTQCSKSFAKCMESDLIYTELNKRGGYVSPVEMFVTTIKINNRQTLSLIA